jgi:hypothetical protein
VSGAAWRHSALVFLGSSLLAFVGIVAAWGCGAFSLPACTGAQPWLAWTSDPRQVLSAILIFLLIVLGIAVVKVYAEMHRDATLSYVTNTMPGALDPEFWFKVLGFGLVPLAGLLTRVFPEISDFIFAWIQPSISSSK